MSTPAVYTFKNSGEPAKEDIHLVYHSDGYPQGAADIIPDLAEVALKIWAGEAVDLEELDLPHVPEVERRESLEESTNIRPTPFRYEIEMVDGHPVMVRALRHDPVIPEELEERLTSAREAFEAAERAMQEARNVPTYLELDSGTVADIRKLGLGYDEEVE